MGFWQKTSVFCVCFFLWTAGGIFAQSASPCPRYPAGSSIVEPEDLYSVKGVLALTLTYRTRIDASGNTLFCFMNSDGAQSPTLHVSPGDDLLINFVNALPPELGMNAPHSMPGMIVTGSASDARAVPW